jgi:nitroimidazol reductase NimA-like FMN-containing flavoprotein (pyridoxamine 5'-phosphate oxidase superfamily)
MLFAERERMEEIIRNCLVCHLALSRDDQPYVLPISFGYDGECLYFHTGFLGQKIDYMEANPRVCFEFEDSVAVAPDLDDPCKTGLTYRSVIGYGRVEQLAERQEKARGLNVLMAQYGQGEHPYSDEALDGVCVWRIVIESMTGKATGS